MQAQEEQTNRRNSLPFDWAPIDQGAEDRMGPNPWGSRVQSFASGFR